MPATQHTATQTGVSCVSTNGGLALVTPAPTPAPAPAAAQSGSGSTLTVRETVTSVISACGVPASSAPVASTPAAKASSSAPAPSASSKCPLDLVSGSYEYPHLIEINGQNGYFGRVDSSSNTSITFDIPASDAGKNCDTYFALPAKADLETSDYTLSLADGVKVGVEMTGVGKVADFIPAVNQKFGIYSSKCPAGQQIKYNMFAEGGLSLSWFNDYNPCPLGMFVVVS